MSSTAFGGPIAGPFVSPALAGGGGGGVTQRGAIIDSGSVIAESNPAWIDTLTNPAVGEYQFTTVVGVYDNFLEWTIQIMNISGNEGAHFSTTPVAANQFQVKGYDPFLDTPLNNSFFINIWPL